MDEDSVIGAESTVAPDGKAGADRICDRWNPMWLRREIGQNGSHGLLGYQSVVGLPVSHGRGIYVELILKRVE